MLRLDGLLGSNLVIIQLKDKEGFHFQVDLTSLHEEGEQTRIVVTLLGYLLFLFPAFEGFE